MEARSRHPYQPFVPENATKLIIGSIPPFRFCEASNRKLYSDDVDFYYGSHDNSFWELLSAVTGTTLDFSNSPIAVEQRKELLCSLHSGITDIIASCVHNGGKSDDASLAEIEYKNVASLLREHPQIDTLIYTSNYIVKLMNAAGVPDKKYHEHWDAARKNGTVVIGGKVYVVHVLYSPSPNTLRRVSNEDRITQYREVFQKD